MDPNERRPFRFERTARENDKLFVGNKRAVTDNAELTEFGRQAGFVDAINRFWSM